MDFTELIQNAEFISDAAFAMGALAAIVAGVLAAKWGIQQILYMVSDEGKAEYEAQWWEEHDRNRGKSYKE